MMTMPSRLPQRRESSKIPGPNQTVNSGNTATISKKFSSFSRSNLLRENSSRASSPSASSSPPASCSTSSCSLSSNLQNSSNHASMLDANSALSRGSLSPARCIRPPARWAMASSATLSASNSQGKSNPSLISRPNNIGKLNSLTTNIPVKGPTLREAREDIESSCFSPDPNRSDRINGHVNSNSLKSSLIDEGNGSLSESGTCPTKNQLPKPFIRPKPGLPRIAGIPTPKSRPSSVCLESSAIPLTSSSGLANYDTTNNKMGQNTLTRPLSGSGMLKNIEASARTEASREVETERAVKTASSCDSNLVPTKSEPNVARVSPIRRRSSKRPETRTYHNGQNDVNPLCSEMFSPNCNGNTRGKKPTNETSNLAEDQENSPSLNPSTSNRATPSSVSSTFSSSSSSPSSFPSSPSNIFSLRSPFLEPVVEEIRSAQRKSHYMKNPPPKCLDQPISTEATCNSRNPTAISVAPKTDPNQSENSSQTPLSDLSASDFHDSQMAESQIKVPKLRSLENVTENRPSTGLHLPHRRSKLNLAHDMENGSYMDSKAEHKSQPLRIGSSHQGFCDINDVFSVTPPPGFTASISQVKRLSNNSELRGSSVSLLSTSSSSFLASDERHNQEVKKFKEELARANAKVENLASQLKNSNEMIQTFGQSLDTLRTRLHQCSLNAEQKDREISRLKSTIEVLRRECQIGSIAVNGTGESCSDVETRREKLKKRLKEPRSPSSDREESGSSWFRGSITRAFKKNRSRYKSGGSSSDVEQSPRNFDSKSLPGTPVMKAKNPLLNRLPGSTGDTSLLDDQEGDPVENLKRQLKEKERQLNEIRLEALLNASQLESMNERISRMGKEMSNLRSENLRLQSLLQRQSVDSSVSSLASFSEVSPINNSPGIERKVFIKLLDKPIGYVCLGPKANWDQLDDGIMKVFEEFLRKIDSDKLDLSLESLQSFSCGNERSERCFKEQRSSAPSPLDLLFRANHINLYLKSKLDYLAIESSTPKSVFKRLMSVLKDSQRLIICGPSHIGKSFLAFKCCQFVLEEKGIDFASSVASVTVKASNYKEIECFLANLLTCEPNSRPKAIIFKNIHTMPNFASLLAPLRQPGNLKQLPIIVCTSSTHNYGSLLTNMQTCHHFQCVYYTHNSEPCRNFLSRILRKKAIDAEIDAIFKGCSFDFQLLTTIIDWIQQLYHHINVFMEGIASPSDAFSHSLATKIFLSCPMDYDLSKDWFIETWNCSIVPIVRKFVESRNSAVNFHSLRDPTSWVIDGFPWSDSKESCAKIMPMLESGKESCKSKMDSITNQLHNTLLRLQKTTNG